MIYFSNSQSKAISKMGGRIIAKGEALEKAVEDQYQAEAI
jgi:hypothetical protein